MSRWWDKKSKIPFNEENFKKIIDFYLFNCPVETESGNVKKQTKKYKPVSARARSLRQRGWVKQYCNSLIASMKKNLTTLEGYESLAPSGDVETAVKNLQTSSTLMDNNFELVVYQERNDMNKTNAIFYYIRNAFAHGSFSVAKVKGENLYYFESSKDGKVKAQIRLKETTLLTWIELVEGKPVKTTKNKKAA